MRHKTDTLSRRRKLFNGSQLISQLRRLIGSFSPKPLWDDGAPIRSELFSVDRLEEHAKSLAAAQAVTPREVKGDSLVQRLADNEAVLLAAYYDIAEAVDAGATIASKDKYHEASNIHARRDDFGTAMHRSVLSLRECQRSGNGFRSDRSV